MISLLLAQQRSRKQVYQLIIRVEQQRKACGKLTFYDDGYGSLEPNKQHI